MQDHLHCLFWKTKTMPLYANSICSKKCSFWKSHLRPATCSISLSPDAWTKQKNNVWKPEPFQTEIEGTSFWAPLGEAWGCPKFFEWHLWGVLMGWHLFSTVTFTKPASILHHGTMSNGVFERRNVCHIYDSIYPQ